MEPEAQRAGPRGPYGAYCTVTYVMQIVYSVVSAACLAAYTFLVLSDVLLREMIGIPAFWPGEFAMIAFIWSTLAGAAAACYHQQHFVVDVLPAMSGWGDRAFRTLVAVAILVVSLFMLVYGYQFALDGLRRTSNLLAIPLIYVYAAFPVAAIGLILFTLEHLVNALTGRADPSKLELEA